MMKTMQMSILLSSAAAVLAAPGLALAQTAPQPPADTGLREIVVTATRSATTLQRTPVAITAFTSKALEDKNVRTLQDVATFTPNLSIIGRASSGGAAGSFAIRGMGVDSTNSLAAVGTYIDDVYQSAARGNILGLLDVNRVEVLRGPQGTLFGRNTIAGAIQYITNDPTQTPGGFIEGTVGNLKRVGAQGAINLPLTETLAIRVAGKVEKRDGYVKDNYAGINRGADKNWGARVKLRWKPVDRLTIDLKGEYSQDITNGQAALIDQINPNSQFIALGTALGETRPIGNQYLSTNFTPGHYETPGSNAPAFFRTRNYLLQGVAKFDLSDNLTIKSITAGAWDRSALAYDADLTPLSFLAVVSPNARSDTFTQELQAIGKAVGGRLNYTVGVYYYNNKSIQNPGNGIVSGMVDFGYIYGNPGSKTTSISGYGQAGFKVTDKLTATVGLRYSHEKVLGYLAGINENAPGEVKFNDWSPHFGADYQLTRTVMFYAKASKGFRAGGFTPAVQFIGVYAGGNLPFQPETAWTYEIGSRMEFMNRRLRINPTLFLTDWSNIQFNSINVVGNAPVPTTQNAGNARLKGLELESEFAVTPRLTLSGSLALLNSRYTSVTNIDHTIFPTGFTTLAGPPFIAPNSVATVPDLRVTNTLPQAPKTKYTIGGTYTVPLANDAKITANMSYTWTSRQASAVMLTGSVDMPSYGMLNARIEYTLPHRRATIAVYGRNLSNSYYLVGAQNYAAGYTAGVRELDVGLPREYGATLRVGF